MWFWKIKYSMTNWGRPELSLRSDVWRSRKLRSEIVQVLKKSKFHLRCYFKKLGIKWVVRNEKGGTTEARAAKSWHKNTQKTRKSKKAPRARNWKTLELIPQLIMDLIDGMSAGVLVFSISAAGCTTTVERKTIRIGQPSFTVRF